MNVTQVYKYKRNDIVFVGADLQKDDVVLETLDILDAEEGYELFLKSTNENIGTSVWLKENDNIDNYYEQQIEFNEKN